MFTTGKRASCKRRIEAQLLAVVQVSADNAGLVRLSLSLSNKCKYLLPEKASLELGEIEKTESGIWPSGSLKALKLKFSYCKVEVSTVGTMTKQVVFSGSG